jgi:hypothetical protein
VQPEFTILGISPINEEQACFVPFWFLVLLTGLLPLRCGLLMRGRWRREKRRRLGLCEHCGYSLVGNVSGVCPECGTAIAKAAE